MFNKTTDKAGLSDAQDSAPDAPEEKENAFARQASAESQEPQESNAEAACEMPQGGDEWQQKYQQLQEQFTRLAADFDNYRKRVREEQQSLAKYGAEKSVLELLPVLDNLDRATASLNENSDPKVLFQSFNLMSRQLMNGLEALGVQKIQAVGQPFDPQFHEAVSRMDSPDVPENTILHEAQSGYMLHDKVIRPAQVVVSAGSGQESAQVEAGAGEKAHNPFQNPA